jgi:hypothetical protein
LVEILSKKKQATGKLWSVHVILLGNMKMLNVACA